MMEMLVVIIVDLVSQIFGPLELTVVVTLFGKNVTVDLTRKRVLLLLRFLMKILLLLDQLILTMGMYWVSITLEPERMMYGY